MALTFNRNTLFTPHECAYTSTELAGEGIPPFIPRIFVGNDYSMIYFNIESLISAGIKCRKNKDKINFEPNLSEGVVTLKPNDQLFVGEDRFTQSR